MRRRPSSPPHPLFRKLIAYLYLHARVNGGTFTADTREHKRDEWAAESRCSETCEAVAGTFIR
jgi:hypothetical protein